MLLALFASLTLGEDWRTQALVNVQVSEVATTLERPGDEACAPLAEIPAAAGRAEFAVRGAANFRGRVLVKREGATLTAAVVTSPILSGNIVRIALPRGARSTGPAEVCLESAQRRDVEVLGSAGTPALRLVGSREESRLSQLGAMLQRTDRGKGAPLSVLGGWPVLVLGLGTLALGLVVAVRTWSRSEDRRPSRRMWIAVGLVAVLHATTWAVLVPAFQVPDEASHFQYVAYVADHGELPSGTVAGQPPYSESHLKAEELLQTSAVAFRPDLRPPWSANADDALNRALSGASTGVPNVHTNATSQPPLYYLSILPAALGGGDALDVLGRLRLFSALWLVAAALGAGALVRALAPARPRWAITVALLVALFPLLGFLGGGVNPDVAMTALALWTFAAAIRCWRDGANRRNLATFALLLALLMLTKLTALAVAPGALLIVAAALVRDWNLGGGGLRDPARSVAAGVVVAVPVFVTYTVLSLLSDRSIIPGVVGGVAAGSGTGAAPGAGNLAESLSATWQLFLPRLPFQLDQYPDTPLWTIWADGLLGRFGYLDYGFPEWVRRLGAGVWLLVVVGAIVGMARLVRGAGARDAVRRFGPVLAGGAVAIASLLVVVGRSDYSSRITNGPPFQQARYLLPGLPIALLALPLALRGVGARLTPVLGVVLVGIATAWVMASFGITLARYWG